MSKRRNFRLRKKMHLDGFIEYGFEIKFACSGKPEMEFLVDLTMVVLHPRNMVYLHEDNGSLFISSTEESLNEDDIDAVKAWLQSQSCISSFMVGPLVDAWHPPRCARCFDIPNSRRKTLLLINPRNG